MFAYERVDCNQNMLVEAWNQASNRHGSRVTGHSSIDSRSPRDMNAAGILLTEFARDNVLFVENNEEGKEQQVLVPR